MAKKSKKDETLDKYQSGGVNIKAKDVKVGGDVVGRNKTVINREKENLPQPKFDGKRNEEIRSAWANGSFYLFTFLVVIGVVGWFAGSLNPISLGVVVIAGIIVVPLIGTLQLYMDKRLTEKSFLSLIKIVIRQLPIISSLTKSG